MKNTGGIMRKVIHVAIVAILFIFGTTARAGSSTNYVIFANPTSLSFTVPAGGAAAAQSVKVNDTTPGPLPFTLSVDQPWVTISTTSSTTAGGGVVLQFGVNPAGLQAGSYTGHVILTASGVANSPMAFPVTLTVTSNNNNGAGAPAIMSQPTGQAVVAGKAAAFRVTASGNAPMMFQWKKNGVAINGATSSSYLTPPVSVSDNNARFTAEVTNDLGTAQSHEAVLTVTQATNYVIFANPTSLSFSMKAGGAAATQSVKVNDTTPGPLPFTLSVDQPWVTVSTTTSTTAGGGVMLQFGVNPAGLQAGNYTGHVILTAAGVANSPMAFPVTLAITSAPSSNSTVAPAITSQPASAKVIAGQSASFQVAATGTAPMTYQWSKNGAPIGGATSSTYTTPAETTADNNATFTVAVSNSAGSATSNTATLMVGASALLLNSSASSLNFGNVTLPGSSTQSVTLTNAGNSSVTISNVSVSGAGFNVNGASGVILAPGQTATLTATFAPAAAGSAAGKITVSSNATNSPGVISLSGTAVAAANHSVALSWLPSTSSVMGYNAYSSTQSGGPYTKLTNAPVAATSFTDTAVQAGQTYYFVVTSVDSSSVESAYSAEVSALVP